MIDVAMELCCGPISMTEVEAEIPFLCSIVNQGGSQQVGVMYGVGCQDETTDLWTQWKIQTSQLDEWIADSQRRGIYTPGDSDLFIYDGDRLTVRLCHESDIHVITSDPSIVRECIVRWLEKGFRVLRKRLSAGKGWKEVTRIEDVTISSQETTE